MSDGLHAERLFEAVLRREGIGVQKTEPDDDHAFGFDFYLWSDNPARQVLVDLTTLADSRNVTRKLQRATARRVVVVWLRYDHLQQAMEGDGLAGLAATIAVLATTARSLTDPGRVADRCPMFPPQAAVLAALSEEQQQGLLELARLRLRTVLVARQSPYSGGPDSALRTKLERQAYSLQASLHVSGIGPGLLASVTGRSSSNVRRSLRKWLEYRG